MQLSIIIISYNTKDILVECLQSIFKQKTNLEYEIIVVDNASTDGTQALLLQHFPQIKLIQNSDNIGFAQANNQAAQAAQGEYLLFLNSDTKIRNQALDILVQAISDYQADIASCQLLNSDLSIQPQGGSLPNLFNIMTWMTFIDDIPGLNLILPRYQQSRSGYFTKDRQPGWLAGTALLIKKSSFELLQGFDAEMFMYGEDVDLCLRAHQKHLKLVYTAKGEIIHLGQASGSSSKAILGEFQALLYIYRKHKPAWHLPLLRLWLKIGALLRVVIFGIIGRDHERKLIYQQAFSLV